jgi:hypothetical protein
MLNGSPVYTSDTTLNTVVDTTFASPDTTRISVRLYYDITAYPTNISDTFAVFANSYWFENPTTLLTIHSDVSILQK